MICVNIEKTYQNFYEILSYTSENFEARLRFHFSYNPAYVWKLFAYKNEQKTNIPFSLSFSALKKILLSIKITQKYALCRIIRVCIEVLKKNLNFCSEINMKKKYIKRSNTSHNETINLN